jgi:DNA repair exonuclease SbcCD ATPase subunit
MTERGNMDYRDQLTAAYQEIEALKSRLRELGQGGGAPAHNLQALQDHLEQYKTYAKQLEEHIAKLEQENNAMRSPSSTAPSGLLKLYDHNRHLPEPSLLTSRERAGVLCPFCKSIGLHHGDQEIPESVEMVLAPWVLGDDISGVICPRCLWTGYKKLR